MRTRSFSILAALGSLALAAGAYLPWLAVDPRLPPDEEVPSVAYAGLEAGIAGVDYVLLALAGVVLLAHLTPTREPPRSMVTLLTGVFAVFAPVGYLLVGSDVGFVATFVPALGWYVTFAAGVLLSVVGGIGILGAAALRPR